ncbi:MAG: NAD(P)/FAD-dependent oxidoreductase [Acidobacteriia bacterium]|nr:NAD(P)/FAD-dependent oxidoreductase [Terriglobia bacterium]
MPDSDFTRRALLRAALAAAPLAAFDWDAIPANAGPRDENKFDAAIIGSGLGGLSCAAAFARKGYRPLVLEQHDKPGGYATAFSRPGGFVFDVSLHSTSVGERNGVPNLIGGFPEITGVEFVAHPNLYRAIFPDHDIRVAQHDLPAYVAQLVRQFPAEKPGIEGLFADMRNLSLEVARLSRLTHPPDQILFPIEFPMLVRYGQQTWGQMMDAHLHDPKLKAIVSAQWAYYGLPPSKLASFYYAIPAVGYLEGGGYYPKGRSQTISDALVKLIETRGGKVLLNTSVDRILASNGAAYGVHCVDGREFHTRAVVSNASAGQTFHRLLAADPETEDGSLAAYQERLAGFSTSLSSFQVFLGLNRDLVRELEIPDSEIFIEHGYDPEAGYEAARRADVERSGMAITLYDNLFPGYSPKGKNTVNLIAIQGFDHWEPFAGDYRAGKKASYNAEKQRMAAVLIQHAEEALLPGLSKAIEVTEIGTPLTNLRYTGNDRGAIYGWDQTVDNSGDRRLGHATPIQNLYLAGAWTRPGHGYTAVLQSGVECFAEIARAWA